jgi:hypothetical protein
MSGGPIRTRAQSHRLHFQPCLPAILAGCGKSLRSLLPLSYLPLVIRERFEESSQLLCRCAIAKCSNTHETAFSRTLLECRMVARRRLQKRKVGALSIFAAKPPNSEYNEIFIISVFFYN